CCSIYHLVLLSFPTRRSSDLYILDLFVDPEFRDIRLGQRLLEACKDLCGDQNLKAVLVGCILWDYEACQESLSATQYIDQVESRSEEHTSELQSRENLVCRLL